jgi:SAM-dependent methyltransferase
MPLTGRYATHGIEINPEAARIADGRGVRIVGHDLAELEQTGQRFDAVIACDVIEHMADPHDFLRRMLAVTAPQGYVIISTGNPDAWSWRLAGSRFWYCYLPEHISFVSPRWFAHQAPQLDARVLQCVPFRYSPHFRTPGRELRLALMALFRLSPTLYYRLLPPAKRNNIPVGRGITRDHFLATLQKN